MLRPLETKWFQGCRAPIFEFDVHDRIDTPRWIQQKRPLIAPRRLPHTKSYAATTQRESVIFIRAIARAASKEQVLPGMRQPPIPVRIRRSRSAIGARFGAVMFDVVKLRFDLQFAITTFLMLPPPQVISYATVSDDFIARGWPPQRNQLGLLARAHRIELRRLFSSLDGNHDAFPRAFFATDFLADVFSG